MNEASDKSQPAPATQSVRVSDEVSLTWYAQAHDLRDRSGKNVYALLTIGRVPVILEARYGGGNWSLFTVTAVSPCCFDRLAYGPLDEDDTVCDPYPRNACGARYAVDLPQFRFFPGYVADNVMHVLQVWAEQYAYDPLEATVLINHYLDIDFNGLAVPEELSELRTPEDIYGLAKIVFETAL